MQVQFADTTYEVTTVTAFVDHLGREWLVKDTDSTDPNQPVEARPMFAVDEDHPVNLRDNNGERVVLTSRKGVWIAAWPNFEDEVSLSTSKPSHIWNGDIKIDPDYEFQLLNEKRKLECGDILLFNNVRFIITQVDHRYIERNESNVKVSVHYDDTHLLKQNTVSFFRGDDEVVFNDNNYGVWVMNSCNHPRARSHSMALLTLDRAAYAGKVHSSREMQTADGMETIQTGTLLQFKDTVWRVTSFVARQVACVLVSGDPGTIKVTQRTAFGVMSGYMDKDAAMVGVHASENDNFADDEDVIAIDRCTVIKPS